MGLEIEADHIVGREPAELHGGRRRQHARIGGEQIAARGQHVAAAALRRAGRAGLHALAVERRQQSDALGLRACLPERIGRSRRRAAAEDMQPILDGEVFQVAEPGIDLAQRLVRIELRRHASLARKPRALRGLDDQPRQTLAAAAIQPVGDGIFIDQALKLLRGAAELGVHQRRRQMTDGHGSDATLGLRRFSRIADEERIEHGQRADDRLRET